MSQVDPPVLLFEVSRGVWRDYERVVSDYSLRISASHGAQQTSAQTGIRIARQIDESSCAEDQCILT